MACEPITYRICKKGAVLLSGLAPFVIVYCEVVTAIQNDRHEAFPAFPFLQIPCLLLCFPSSKLQILSNRFTEPFNPEKSYINYHSIKNIYYTFVPIQRRL